MKRLIKFWSDYDYAKNGQFSLSSTKYEVMPEVVDRQAGPKELRALAKKHKIKLASPVKKGKKPEGYRESEFHITHFAGTNKADRNNYKKEKRKIYLGFITIPSIDGLPVKTRANSSLTQDQIYDLINDREAGIDNIGDLEGEYTIIKQGWEFYHMLPLNGYSLEKFMKDAGAKGSVFYDDVDHCSQCGEFDYRDNGYSLNHRHTNDGTFGINCGCFEAYVEKNVEEYANDPNNPIELETAEKLEKEGRLKFVERFIGGWTDGRGGYYKGEPTREGNPKEVVPKLMEESPNAKFIVSHDESGQFQTYWSVWRLVTVPKVRKAAKK